MSSPVETDCSVIPQTHKLLEVIDSIKNLIPEGKYLEMVNILAEIHNTEGKVEEIRPNHRSSVYVPESNIEPNLSVIPNVWEDYPEQVWVPSISLLNSIRLRNFELERSLNSMRDLGNSLQPIVENEDWLLRKLSKSMIFGYILVGLLVLSFILQIYIQNKIEILPSI